MGNRITQGVVALLGATNFVLLGEVLDFDCNIGTQLGFPLILKLFRKQAPVRRVSVENQTKSYIGSHLLPSPKE